MVDSTLEETDYGSLEMALQFSSSILVYKWWIALLTCREEAADESRIAREELLTDCDPVPIDEEG